LHLKAAPELPDAKMNGRGLHQDPDVVPKAWLSPFMLSPFMLGRHDVPR
jgi:hypothetical protein